ncbi:MAG TPA: monofunctional biosynthetic peptidoglycan transglycosylase [Caulobacteraceae bacterium]|nr:monofunctional biosynthetic peptidoglycan transglycosylase [Caulobacteraceae bacterium]
MLAAIGRLARNALLALAALIFVAGPAVALLYRFVPPPITFLMVERWLHGRGMERRWTPISEISPVMVRSVIASEDSRFCAHHGFDFAAMRAALAHDASGGRRLRGGSTISQQTAKNVFLWPDRSWVRKGLEAWFTVLIETLWGKRRIIEVYLNTVEMGPGLYGVGAASERYFHAPPSRLTPIEAARLAAILPDPLKWRVVRPGPYVRRRSGSIDARAGLVRRDDLAGCVLGPRR